MVDVLEGTRPVRRTVDPVGPKWSPCARCSRTIAAGWDSRVRRVDARVIVRLARLGDHLGGPINSTAMAQLEFATPETRRLFEAATGCNASGWRAALAAEPAHVQDRWHARLYFVLPLRAALVLLCLASGVAGLFALDDWASPRAATPIPGRSLAALAAACVLDLVVALVARWRPRRLALLQLLAIGAYMLGATALWPALWAEPLGPLLKNLPILAAVATWGAIEEER